jgi:hypothetical protein
LEKSGIYVEAWRFTRPRSSVKLTTMRANSPEPEIVMRKGKAVSVIIAIKDYEELLERAEDAEDVAWLKRARRKKLQYRPLEEYLAKRNGK